MPHNHITMPMRDPRSFIKIAALPIDSQRGFKIQARSFHVYSTAEPSREEIRMRNFQRRSAQFSSQGYQSVKHKAYCGIGDPFYLDEKKLMLHSLGQLNEVFLLFSISIGMIEIRHY